MTSLQEKLLAMRNKLKPTETIVVSESGQEVIERRGVDGQFERVGTEEVQTVQEEEDMQGSEISNRRRKKVQRLQRMGFVVDLKPDMQLAELYPGLFVGSQDVAADLQLLKVSGISHIVNCATGIHDHFPTHFVYLHLDMLDLPSTSIEQHLDVVHGFIDKCLENNGKILVHCNAGVSRSATFALSYVMLKKSTGLSQALADARIIRPAIRPNDGFLKQLKEYEQKLGISK